MAQNIYLSQPVYYDGLIWTIKTIVGNGELVTLARENGSDLRHDVPSHKIFTEMDLRNKIK